MPTTYSVTVTDANQRAIEWHTRRLNEERAREGKQPLTEAQALSVFVHRALESRREDYLRWKAFLIQQRYDASDVATQASVDSTLGVTE